ncbi:hypothetical protein [Methyloterricola oryzae]|uniref:hypothetical protein n=1 Tax=Methyloterricola oryzae TaxID=1495050 RepID=UPI0005EB19EE|nr:hypothetical protein [Methyloterricola oryzae]
MKRLTSLLLTLSVLFLGLSIADESGAQKFPDVLNVKVRLSGDRIYDFDVTLSSPYDTVKHYADAFRVSAPDGKVFGERVLVHDHANEQPFTRDLYGVSIPANTRTVIVQARDRQFGYGGKSMEVLLPSR